MFGTSQDLHFRVLSFFRQAFFVLFQSFFQWVFRSTTGPLYTFSLNLTQDRCHPLLSSHPPTLPVWTSSLLLLVTPLITPWVSSLLFLTMMLLVFSSIYPPSYRSDHWLTYPLLYLSLPNSYLGVDNRTPYLPTTTLVVDVTSRALLRSSRSFHSILTLTYVLTYLKIRTNIF